MGVHGLWRLIEPSGKPVPLETLENKVLAVDVSIWLHHFIKGFQDSKGAPLPNAHLLGIYHRLCKLLYFRIKPVFVFDGGVPVLKKQTIALRNQRKSKNLSEADRIHKNLLSALVKHTAISKVLSEKAKAAITASTSPTKKTERDDLYVLPPTQFDSTVSSEEDESSADDSLPSKVYDLHSIDTQSAEFKALPADLRHEILTDLKETRKQNSWGRIHELPVESDDFASYQMRRLLKRQSVQTALEQVEKEMGGYSLSLGELEKILKDQGVINNMKGNRIASDENTRFLLIKDIKQAIEEAKNQNSVATKTNKPDIELEDELQKAIVLSLEEPASEEKTETKADKELDDELQKAIALSLEEPSEEAIEPSTSEEKVKKLGGRGKNRMPLSFIADFEDADFDDSESSEEETFQMKLTPAQRYMMEYSGLTPNEIAKIIASKSRVKNKMEKTEKVTAAKTEKSPSENKTVTTTSEDKNNVTETSIEDRDQVEVMSDSGSSNSEDFVDVEESTKEKVAGSMEVVIKPDEELEDDLFKDIFADEEKSKPIVETGISEEPPILEEVTVDDREVAEQTPEKIVDNKEVEETVSPSQSLKDKIEKMIKNYSEPKEKKEAESPKLSLDQLNEMQANLRREQVELTVEKSNKERLAGNITDQMYQEAQELLELFGVPYVIAPMEAEAQCAFLELIGLTDGTITDDSDIWLFGGRTVYKNFFNQNKMVMEYKSDNIQHHYKLTREQMILLAMLVGSDYTTGLTGVGPVTALEILAAFPPKNHLVSGLAEFKSWFTRGKFAGPGRKSLRSKLRNLNFTESFPNPQIAQAYLEPQVETNKDKFTWAKPYVVGLTDFARQKFGWNEKKTGEVLNPVMKRLEERRTQKSITEYFKRGVTIDSGETEKLMSKRVKSAIERIGKGDNGEGEEEPKMKKKKVSREKAKTKRVVKKKYKEIGETSGGENSKKKPVVEKKNEEIDETTTGKRVVGEEIKEVDEEISILKQTKARSKKRVQEIEKEVQKAIEVGKKKKVDLQRLLHKKEVIPQKQRDKSDMLKNKMRAIETFRKSKHGPGFVKKKGKASREPQQDAGYLSENSSSD